MSKFAYIVASNKRYLPGLNALLNSLDYVGNTQDVLVLGYELPEEFMNAVDNAFTFRVVWGYDIPQSEVNFLGEAEVLMRKRYQMPFILQEIYEAVCILDADMFFAHNVEVYLEIAAKTGYVLGCVLEQKRRYGDKNHQVPPGSGTYLIDPDFWNARDLCCAPLFVGRPWYPALKKSWDLVNVPFETRFKAPDMDGLNICLIEAGSFEKTIPLSQHIWTGLHESFMKAHTRAVDCHGQLFTEDGEEINVVHGQWWNKTWRGWQIDNQIAMIGREFDDSESYKNRARGSFEHVLNWYKKMAVEHKININDYIKDCSSHSEVTDVMEIT